MPKNDLIRFSVSVDWELIKEFDELIHKEGFENRSLAIRFLLRDYIRQIKQKYPDTKGIFSIITYSKEPIIYPCETFLNLSIKNNDFFGVCLKECTYHQAINIAKKLRSTYSIEKCEVIPLDLEK